MTEKRDGEEEARRILDRVRRDSETFGSSSMARAGEGSADRDKPAGPLGQEEDRVEVLGRRIGRTLGAVAAIVLFAYLLKTYVL